MKKQNATLLNYLLMQITFWGLFLAFLLVNGIPSIAAANQQEVRVGIHDNKPMCYLDKDGKPSGIFVAVLEYTAAQEGWQLKYIKDDWSALRSQLEKGEIDVLLSMAVSEERKKIYKFNQLDIFNNWAEVYVKPGGNLNSLLALREKRVATTKKGIYTAGPEGILKINDNFHLNLEIIPRDSFKDVLIAVRNGAADAGVVNRLTGATYEKELGLQKSGIVFSPVAIRFGFNRNNPQTPRLAAAIDQHFASLQQDSDSVYHNAINNAFGDHFIELKVLPDFVKLSIIGIIAMLVVLTSFMCLLHRQVKTKTCALQKKNKELTENEKKYRRLVESTSTVPWEVDLASGKFTYMGRQIEKILGYPANSWTDLDTWANRLHAEDRNDAVEFCSLETKKGNDHEFTFRAIHVDGSVRWIRDIVAIVMGEKGPEKLIGFMNDISESKTMALANDKLEKHLQHIQKLEAIGTLAGGIAHDFNNILGAIIGYADMAKDGSPKGSAVAKDLDKVLSAGYRARDLVKQILTFSRQHNESIAPFQPVVLVKEVIKMLRPSLPSTIKVCEDIDLHTGSVLAEPTQIHQITMNLCTNAFHAMEETGGLLHISLKETVLSADDLQHEIDVAAGRFIKLSVCDSGPGIAKDIKDRIFEPYFTTKEVGKGTGMGLSIIHGIVKKMGGFISLYSEPGHGCAFHVFLPIVEKENSQEKQVVELVPTGKERILFIDDEEMLAEMSHDMLTRLGYHVTVRTSSLEALETFQNQPDTFDLIITDQTMPGMTGVDLARRMMQIRPSIPIILCTGYSTAISEEKAANMGIKAFVLKPLIKKDIAGLIRKILDGPKLIIA